MRFALNPVCVMSLYPLYVISGIRYIRNALNRVCAKKCKGGPFGHENWLMLTENINKLTKGTFENFREKSHRAEKYPERVPFGPVVFLK